MSMDKQSITFPLYRKAMGLEKIKKRQEKKLLNERYTADDLYCLQICPQEKVLRTYD